MEQHQEGLCPAYPENRSGSRPARACPSSAPQSRGRFQGAGRRRGGRGMDQRRSIRWQGHHGGGFRGGANDTRRGRQEQLHAERDVPPAAGQAPPAPAIPHGCVWRTRGARTVQPRAVARVPGVVSQEVVSRKHAPLRQGEPVTPIHVLLS